MSPSRKARVKAGEGGYIYFFFLILHWNFNEKNELIHIFEKDKECRFLSKLNIVKALERV